MKKISLQNDLAEAKRLKKHYDKLGVTDCYCDQNSTAECPKHIESYIASVERVISSDDDIHNKGKR